MVPPKPFFWGDNFKTLRPTSTLALLRQRLHRTSEAPLKVSHVYYNLTIFVLHTNRYPVTTTYYFQGQRQTGGQTGGSIQDQMLRLPGYRPTLVKSAETLARDWPNTNEWREMVTLTIALLNTIYRRNIKSAGTLRHVLRILQTTINDSF